MFKTRLFKKKKPTVIIDNCEKLTLWRYLRITETGDLTYLVKSGDKPSQIELQSIFNKIIQEYQDLKGSNEQKLTFDKITYIEELNLKVKIVSSLLIILEESVSDQLINTELLEKYIYELKKWGYRINKDAPLNDEIKTIIADLKALKTTIEILQNELFPENENENEKLTKQQKVLQFYEMLLSYQRILEIDKINVKKTSLLELINIEKQVMSKIEAQNKSIKNNN